MLGITPPTYPPLHTHKLEILHVYLDLLQMWEELGKQTSERSNWNIRDWIHLEIGMCGQDGVVGKLSASCSWRETEKGSTLASEPSIWGWAGLPFCQHGQGTTGYGARRVRTSWDLLGFSAFFHDGDYKEGFLRIMTTASFCLPNLMPVSPLANSNQPPEEKEILVPHLTKVTSIVQHNNGQYRNSHCSCDAYGLLAHMMKFQEEEVKKWVYVTVQSCVEVGREECWSDSWTRSLGKGKKKKWRLY